MQTTSPIQRRSLLSDRDSDRRLSIGSQIARWAAIAVILLAVAGGCADMDAYSGDFPESADDAAPTDNLQRAEAHLANHRVDDAHDVYLEMLQVDPHDGAAAAGAATTGLLLMLEMDEVTTLLINHLNANGSIDANDLLFSEEGYLYWASRGVRWTEDSDEYEGIQDLVVDHLPWESERLESLEAFVDGLDNPVGAGVRQLITVVNALSSIESHIDTAIADPDFVRLYIPGEVFHHSSLSLRVGRSELAAIHSLIELTRGVIYFLGAYEHAWTLQDAFGSWRHDPPGDRYIPGHGPKDYTVEYLDDHLLRQIGSSDRLSASRTSLRNAIGHARDSIRHGLEEPVPTTLDWEQVDEQHAAEIDDLLDAVAAALDGPTELPHVQPTTTVDLSPLFSDSGRVLPLEIPWFVPRDDIETVDDDDDTDGFLGRWKLNGDAVDYMFIAGVFDPPPQSREDIDVNAGGGDPHQFFDTLFGSYWEQVETIYFTTR